MDSEEILALYTWAPGVCFRHPAAGEVETATVKKVHPRHGGEEEVRACRTCVLVIERDRREAALKAGLPYEPGHAGEAPV
ncbi:hypothetical protein [Streptomyces sp. BA2]|uniref:hypothetical protein n=1 Tax=Streptomyces sp. BA2 TaxID=436595 RepID=UPI001324454A|nr:hypothetical protein [Streptomyces sp. BA2]MWA08694.1 hypothetical protein [Streptomyces sp. BA2]